MGTSRQEQEGTNENGVFLNLKSSRRSVLAAGASFTAGALCQGASPAWGELTPMAQKIANEVTPGAQGTEINGKKVVSECRGSRGQSCNVWVPPTVEPSPAYTGPKAEITAKVFFDVRIIKDYTKEVLEDGVQRGRIVFGLYGKAAPKTVTQFLTFVQSGQGAMGPTYSSSLFFRQEAGKWMEGGKISGLSKTEIAGLEEYEWMGRVVPLSSPLEANPLVHDSRMLLSHRKFNPGPEFSVTLAPAPELDGPNTVFGEVLEGQELITAMAELPFVTGKSLDPTGSPSDQWWQAQNRYFQSLAKQLGDSRVSNKYPGKLLRRVEVTKCGLA